METLDSSFLLHLQFNTSTSCCPHCHSHKLHGKDYRNQKILLGHWDVSPVFALVHKQRYVCTSYYKTFYEHIPDIGWYQRRSNNLINKILYACSKMMNFKIVTENKK